MFEYMSDNIYSPPISEHLVSLRVAHSCGIIIR
nr:MAG TPA: hypothetical protein [Caudoviricetes sp.]